MRAALLLSLAAALCAVEIDVDKPDRWYDPDASHHLEHAGAGVTFGAPTFAISRIALGLSRPASYAASAAAGGAANVVWEVRQTRLRNAEYVDPIDVLWGIGGGLAGGALADAGITGAQVLVGRDRWALAMEWSH